MNLDKTHIAIGLALILTGSFIGGYATYTSLDQRLDEISAQAQKQDTVKIVRVNGSNDDVMTELFNQVDESVVSITAYGKKNAQGSGFIYSEKGYIVTNEHVVSRADSVQVTFTDGETVNAKIIGKDVYTDLAVLKVKKKGLNDLELGNSTKVKVGQRAIAIGNPFGLRSSMTAGIISQKGRLLPVAGGFSIPNVIQTDAAINPGNSGGPLMNMKGEVVGVNTAIETRTGTFSGIGFAIPVNTVKRVVPEIIQTGDYDHSWIGVSGYDLSPEVAEKMNLNTTSGFLIVDVVKGSPADKAGLKAGNTTVTIRGQKTTIGGDVLVGINGEKMRGISDILLYLSKEAEVGETINVTVIRDGKRKTLPLTLDSRPRD